ncbi:hypothetical protein KLP40_02370 [Hymenobacter sp. NST-14]|uniref:hypothetical protein n=1 Tax=Hymenobacter piscis TaxID=2839984 RepID=UPI001C009D00|nr:hypothetical protein [Hymenobacter piscis]MBT9391997.1 hypothetical protein [Hymenobacter piscis]
MRTFWLLLLALLPLAGRAQPTASAALTSLVRQTAAADGQLLPAPLLRAAHRSLGTARQHFRAGAPAGPAPRLYLLVRTLNEAATPELLVVEPASWQQTHLRGRIVRVTDGQVRAAAAVEFEEAAVLDWLLLYPDGREAGNHFGKFWDLEERLASEDR